jgi:hypothetical protein
MKLRRRVEALEATLLADPVVLHFDDGSRRELRGPDGFLVQLLFAVLRKSDISPVQAERLKLIRRAVGAQEPGGSHLVELMQVLLAAREQAVTDDDIDRSE